jgi:bifunctional non-homologous end joining protein LigD
VSVRLDRGKARILTRRGHDWTERFPTIATVAEEKFAGRSLIIDGEAVVLDEKGRPDFGLLQKALRTRGHSRNPGSKAAHEAMLYAFDLLYIDGRDLRRLPLETRREEFEQIVSYKGVIRLSEEIVEFGATLLRHSCEMGLEGIIAKDREAIAPAAPAIGSRSNACRARVSPSSATRRPKTGAAISRLLMAARSGKQLVYVGGVGTGYSLDEAYGLKQTLDEMPKASFAAGQMTESSVTAASRGCGRRRTTPWCSIWLAGRNSRWPTMQPKSWKRSLSYSRNSRRKASLQSTWPTPCSRSA